MSEGKEFHYPIADGEKEYLYESQLHWRCVGDGVCAHECDSLWV